MTTIHDNLDTAALDLPATAARIGPFMDREFLAATTIYTGTTPEVLESNHGALVIDRSDGTIRLAGHEDLCDYHSSLGHGIEDLVAEFVMSLPSGTRLDLDSLPAEAAEPIERGLKEAGVEVEKSQHEIAAVLDLPATFDDYLAALSKKQRHEVRRKIRRFTEMLGAPRLLRQTGSDILEMFADLHRRSSGDKGTFMTAEMETHFQTLAKEAGAVVDVLYGDDDRPVAAAVGFEDETTTYLYNSAYEPDVAEASPGIVLVASLISDSIARGRTRFDFLKGDEVYKFRMGAVERPLYRLVGLTP